MPAVTRRAPRVPRAVAQWAAAVPGVVAVVRVARPGVAVAHRVVAAVAAQVPAVVVRAPGAEVREAAGVAVMVDRAGATGAAVVAAGRERSVKAPIWSRTSSPSTASRRS